MMRQVILLSLLIVFVGLGCESDSGKSSDKGSDLTEMQDEKAESDNKTVNQNSQTDAINEDDPDRQFQVTGKAASESEKKNLVKGKFQYYADAALFYPCDDPENPVPVKMNGTYELLERSYLNMKKSDPKQKVYLEAIGQYKMDDAMESDRKVLKLNLERLVKMNMSQECDSQQ